MVRALAGSFQETLMTQMDAVEVAHGDHGTGGGAAVGKIVEIDGLDGTVRYGHNGER
jgi:hypothetical protein